MFLDIRKNWPSVICKVAVLCLVFSVVLLIILQGSWKYGQPTNIILLEHSINVKENREACHPPHLELYNEELMKYIGAPDDINCGNNSNDWVMCELSTCYVKPEVIAVHGNITCLYSNIIRASDKLLFYSNEIEARGPYVLQESDFASVRCKADDGKTYQSIVYGIRDNVMGSMLVQFSSDIPIEPSVTTKPIKANVSNYYNVLIYGFDSVSRLAFMRSLPKTYAYLTEKLRAVVLTGYNIVGDGTPQALIPILTGYTELELPETRHRMRNAVEVDIYPMLWKDYARHGYITMYNEDMPYVGTFTYRLKGFKEQPTNHYMRTLYLAHNDAKFFSLLCLGNQPSHVAMLNYTTKFMTMYANTPRFGLSFHGGLSHTIPRNLAAGDNDVVSFLQNLHKKDILKNTILIMMSDHGNRFAAVRATLQGKQEERLPFFSFVFPQSFLRRHPKEYENFVNNKDKLVTPFDIHSTLSHILKLQKRDSQSNDIKDNVVPIVSAATSALAKKRAISLFELIPKNRSCADAYIEPHWCACLNWDPMNLTLHEDFVLEIAASIITTINNATNSFRDVCTPFELKKIVWAMHLMPRMELLKFQGAWDRDGFVPILNGIFKPKNELYQVQLILQPGDLLFEATVLWDLQTRTSFTKLSDISRINKYDTQANCIYDRDPELRKFCYCL